MAERATREVIDEMAADGKLVFERDQKQVEVRAYLDTNPYISFLLNPESPSPPARIMRAGLTGAFTIVFGDPTVDEIVHKAAAKPYLSRRISPRQVDALVTTMEYAGDDVRTAPTVIPAISRDRKDDYLLTYAIAGNATHLVTGDRDLLDLEHHYRFRIVSPAEFVGVLEQEEQRSK